MGWFYSNNNKKLLAEIHKINCILDDVENFTDSNIIKEYVVEKKHRGDFHLDRGSQKGTCETLVCKVCGNDRFIVGQDAYFTAIKCTECGYEVGIHEG